ncbi:DUF4878 domain-containing protein [Youngiibacter multivorans]|uniref:DUF4878 domain-containing protein n=1 Tax=Youngiibacter multivorans TaxID=937251 RepID=A0ABS4G7Y0_9CLOT|nr:DUF4878 domain-containing protein [Youngiibacter multivorans]MBP1920375.1 hypothetical protein [Youngiibacter multivorans]
MKKVISALVMPFLALSLFACSIPSPKDTVAGFFDSSKKADYKTMVAYVDPTNVDEMQNVEVIYSDSDDDIFVEFYQEYLKAKLPKMTYEITNSEINGDKASVAINAKYIDGGMVLKAAMGDVITKAMGMAFSGQNPTDEEMNKLFLDTINEKANTLADTYKEVTLKIDCVKKDGKWYISEVNDSMVDIVCLGFLSAVEDIRGGFEN